MPGTGRLTGMDDEIRSARERGWRELDEIDRALERGEIDAAGWHARTTDLTEASYLSADTPQGQSGHSGDADRWEQARRLVLDACQRPGSFLDVGCANGLLMESVARWSDGAVEPYGVEISAGLADLARRRCPQWTGRIWTANAADWSPGRTFTYVRSGLDYVPAAHRAAYVAKLLDLVEPGGRLIIGTFNEETDEPRTAEALQDWGFAVAGSGTREHRHPRLSYRVVWVSRAD